MITVKTELDSIRDFDAWSGAKDTLENIIAAGKIDELDSLAEEYFPDGCTDTELNDWLWFDSDSIYEYLGLDENGEIPTEDEEDEDEEDDEDEDEDDEEDEDDASKK